MTLLRPRALLFAAIAVLPLAACSSSKAPEPAAAAPAMPMLPPRDATFIANVAMANAAEIAAGLLAQTNATPAIRTFATQMVTDHQLAATRLAALAQSKMVTPPTAPDDAHISMAGALRNVKGRAFDQGYMDAQVADHATLVSMFQDEARQGTDPDVKAFAAQALPMMRQHLALAKRMAPSR